ncbi:hypothetical protein BuS5_01195 [Desulfosarcina sp. BuS5]|nr:hypothetical protein BuS5_01195 [Desulfosarcina sp. BuS5]
MSSVWSNAITQYMETFYDAINITLENIYKMVVDLKHDVALIKKSFMEEPELRDEFISRMRDIDL